MSWVTHINLTNGVDQMQVTLTEMWGSINRIMFPEGGLITAQECGYVIPEALKQCAVVMVRDGSGFGKFYYEDPFRFFMDQQNIVDGLLELRDNGFIKFTDTKENE